MNELLDMLTPTPYQLSRGYIYLVDKPEKKMTRALRETFGQLVSAPIHEPWNPLKNHFFL